MAISVFDLYTIGIGPSSSHTVGPMRASYEFCSFLKSSNDFSKVSKVIVELFGSLAMTGKGHGSDEALILGLMGNTPEKVDPEKLFEIIDTVRRTQKIKLFGEKEISFDENESLIFHRGKSLPEHPNGLCFSAYDEANKKICHKNYYSVGGGFVLSDEEINNPPEEVPLPLEFHTAAALMELCEREGKSISQIMMANERQWKSTELIKADLLEIWHAMQACVTRGYSKEGTLPGGLKVKRRAPEIYRNLLAKGETSLRDPLSILDWVNLYALAVNEENAAGGRVVTAPTNGAAGIIPAVLHYFTRFCMSATDDKVVDFLLTAGAIAILYKKNASISGADVGCQGEVGVACSMAAGALTEVLGGTAEQVENAAEIAMEHNLGLTCDPVGGLVQVPCIERNAMGAVKAINASRMALRGDGTHFISLDKVIKTMLQTGRDMKESYKETSRGGLAVNIIEC